MVIKRQRAQAGLYTGDRINKLNELNLSLQGQDKTFIDFIDALSILLAQEKKDDNGPNGNVSNPE